MPYALRRRIWSCPCVENGPHSVVLRKYRKIACSRSSFCDIENLWSSCGLIALKLCVMSFIPVELKLGIQSAPCR